MQRYYYSALIQDFIIRNEEDILGRLAASNQFELKPTQRDAWLAQVAIVKKSLEGLFGVVAFEFAVPRMGSRIDVVLVVDAVVFVLEFKVGSDTFDHSAIDQAYDYGLDLHYFHEPSHNATLVPIVIATQAVAQRLPVFKSGLKLQEPARAAPAQLRQVIDEALREIPGDTVDPDVWLQGSYSPTPTIVEAAKALYRGHSVEEISRNDAGGKSLNNTSDAVTRVIERSQALGQKAICFVTGVPGAGKTLVGLNIANKHTDKNSALYSVFLSGNGPLVAVLLEALARDAVLSARSGGERLSLAKARTKVQQFIQNVHHFRDECLRDPKPPVEHVALFDEAQRAWNRVQTVKFMTQKKKQENFDASEPEFLISCLDRHDSWSTVVCLVGGGQEINTGEGGIKEWFEALSHFPDWKIYISPQLSGREFDPGERLQSFVRKGRVTYDPALHLHASMRSFRAENVSNLVGALLEIELDQARQYLTECCERYPIYLGRDLTEAKRWIRTQARGSERYGVVVSSAAERLRPHAIHVKAPMDPVHWFLDSKSDVRSSYYMEDVATEFHIQGLELDWACIAWDADFRYSDSGWQNYDFKGSRWERIRKPDRQRYQKNAYRVLLTRARQGMMIVVPQGDPDDPTRLPEFYDPTFEYLRSLGLSAPPA
jgi:hypothetical protein